ncbi:MAG TPA: peptidylprolyl isomerase [Terriglobales bacterium]|nr:peptidylprolyl isomerase [Terriglobales bacterium]
MTLRTRFSLTLILTMIFGGAVLAQQSPAPQSQEPATAKPATSPGESTKKAEDGKPAETAKAEVPPDAPVITINGLCPDKPAVTTGGKTPADCKTVITRAQFEQLATALNPNMPANMKRQLAEVYPRILLLSHEGEKLGVENDEHYKKALHFESLQLLAQETAKKLNDEAAQVSDQQMQQYYKENEPKFEEFTLQRIFIPAPEPPAEPAAQKQPQKEKQMTPEQVKAFADKLHARAVAGEDFDKLQKEAFAAVGLKSTAPTTKVEKLTRGSLPENQNTVFDLKPGSVSQVFSDPGAFYIYKVVSKQTPPFDAVKEEIKRTLQTERLQTSMKSVLESAKTDLNDAYFAEAANPGMPQRKVPDASGKLPPNRSPH